MILVAGATGFLGREICRRLVASGREVRALARTTSDPHVVAGLRQMGVQIVEGDLRDRRSLDAACREVHAVISTATVTRSRQADESIESTDQQGQLSLVDAAHDAGVSQFIYISFSGRIGADDALTTAKRSVEQRIRESGMTFTILRPTFFMEAWLTPALGFDFPSARATVYGSGENKISWISLGDVAEFAVRSLESGAAENAVIELGGPEALTPHEVIRIFEDVAGRPFEVQHVPEPALEAQRADATSSLQRSFATLMLGYARGDAIPMEETLREYPVRLRSVRDYASEAMG